jgi:hypothetical protein
VPRSTLREKTREDVGIWGNTVVEVLVAVMLVLVGLLALIAILRWHSERQGTGPDGGMPKQGSARVRLGEGNESAAPSERVQMTIAATTGAAPVWNVEVVPRLDDATWLPAPQDLAASFTRTLGEQLPHLRTVQRGDIVRLVNCRVNDLVPSRDGHLLGWMRNTSTGHSQEQARLARVRAPTVSPALLLSAASMIVGAHWQQQIDARLRQLQSAVTSLRDVTDARMKVEIDQGRHRLEDLALASPETAYAALTGSDAALVDAVVSVETQLKLLENKLDAAPTPDRKDRVLYESFRHWAESGAGVPGALDLHARVLYGFAVALAYHHSRWHVLTAFGEGSRADHTAEAARRLLGRVETATDRLTRLLDADVQLPVDLRHAVPKVGADRQAGHREDVHRLRTIGVELARTHRALTDGLDSAAQEIAITADGRVLVRSDVPQTLPH